MNPSALGEANGTPQKEVLTVVVERKRCLKAISGHRRNRHRQTFAFRFYNFRKNPGETLPLISYTHLLSPCAKHTRKIIVNTDTE